MNVLGISYRNRYLQTWALVSRINRWRFGGVWIGAALTALLFTVGKFAIGLYLGKSDVGSAYGAAGSLVIVLVDFFAGEISPSDREILVFNLIALNVVCHDLQNRMFSFERFPILI